MEDKIEDTNANFDRKIEDTNTNFDRKIENLRTENQKAHSEIRTNIDGLKVLGYRAFGTDLANGHGTK